MAESIKVALRVRPFNSLELSLDSTCVVRMDGQNTTLLAHGHPKTFTFDFSYWSFDRNDSNFVDQDAIMHDIGNEILINALEGYNGCLFAYGQTGSGKTYSVLGTDEEPGIIPRAIVLLFEEKDRLEQDALREVRIWVSYLEIYNEHLKDLLKPEDTRRPSEICDDHDAVELTVINHPQFGVYVPGLLVEPCSTVAEVNARLVFGMKQRAVGATRMNSQSSRSHTVFCIHVQHLEGAPPDNINGCVKKRSS